MGHGRRPLLRIRRGVRAGLVGKPVSAYPHRADPAAFRVSSRAGTPLVRPGGADGDGGEGGRRPDLGAGGPETHAYTRAIFGLHCPRGHLVDRIVGRLRVGARQAVEASGVVCVVYGLRGAGRPRPWEPVVFVAAGGGVHMGWGGEAGTPWRPPRD